MLFVNDEPALDAAYAVLLDARVELQRSTGRALNVLTLQDQTAVAAALGDPSPEVLMGRIAEAARAIAWMSDDTWRRVRSGLAGSDPVAAPGRVRPIADGVAERDGEIFVEERRVGPPSTRCCVLRVGAASARRDLPIERITLDRLGATCPSRCPSPWPATHGTLFEDLLLAGRADDRRDRSARSSRHLGALVPEWTTVRSRPQHNPYHRFTVDRHLLETIANAERARLRVERPDLLALAALLHDLGKTSDARPHRGRGRARRRPSVRASGVPTAEIDVLRALVRHHLLLSDVASRRDLDDDATIDLVAKAVESVESLQLLAALTEADAKATGPDGVEDRGRPSSSRPRRARGRSSSR